MTTATIITLVVVIAILGLLLNAKVHSGSNSPKNNQHKIMVSINGGEYREAKSDDGEKDWRKKSKSRERRMVRKRKIWAVLRYMTTYRYLMESSDFYSFKKNLDDHKYAKGELRKAHPDSYPFEAAIRFCRMEYYYGTCNHQLTDNDVKFILNWRSNIIDTHETLKNVLSAYKEHWDGVLASYVRPSARAKRLQYLVENLEEMMALPDIQEYPDIIQGIKELQKRYKSQLDGKEL